jgi:hypothetical protein
MGVGVRCDELPSLAAGAPPTLMSWAYSLRDNESTLTPDSIYGLVNYSSTWTY